MHIWPKLDFGLIPLFKFLDCSSRTKVGDSVVKYISDRMKDFFTGMCKMVLQTYSDVRFDEDVEEEDEDLGDEEMWKMKRKVTKRATT